MMPPGKMRLSLAGGTMGAFAGVFGCALLVTFVAFVAVAAPFAMIHLLFS
jgi:hypothetical protein